MDVLETLEFGFIRFVDMFYDFLCLEVLFVFLFDYIFKKHICKMGYNLHKKACALTASYALRLQEAFMPCTTMDVTGVAMLRNQSTITCSIVR